MKRYWKQKTIPIACLFVIVLGSVFVYISVSRRQMTGSDKFALNAALEDDLYNIFFQELLYEKYTRTLLNAADRIKQNAGVILLAMINDAFISLTNSWLCNTKPFDIHKHVLFITTDKTSEKMIKSSWPNIEAIYISALDLHGDQEYSRAGYVKMMHLRTQIIRVLIENNFALLLFETDCLWIENPLPDVEAHGNNKDMVLVKPTHKNGYLGGFQLLNPTKNVKTFYLEFSKKMWHLYKEISSYSTNDKVSEYHNDQVYFSDLLKGPFKNVKISIVSPEKYVDGKWYTDFTDKKRKELKPYIINNNWVRGNQGKISRAKLWGHWFLHDNNTCNEQQVRKIIKL